MDKTVLIVDDDKKIADLISFHLRKQGYETQSVYCGKEAIEYAEAHRPVLVMLDIWLPDLDGKEVLKILLKHSFRPSVIMISAHAEVKLAVECMKLGAYDFIEKPFALVGLDTKVAHVFKQRGLEEEVSMLQNELGEKYRSKNLVGKSPAMKKIFQAINLVVRSNVNVLIEGESGTGKELVARAIHFSGQQSKGPFIAVNCSAVPETLLESEFFGHEKGAFTGASVRRIGKFEQAECGTIFLDEIGDLSGALQAKLLRVLQEREIERLGGTGSVPINVRFIAATNKDLKKLVQEGRFREDLYFRVNVFLIRIPPLREHREDILELIRYFVKQRSGLASDEVRIEPEAFRQLIEYHWPGNVRELENFVERLLVIKDGNFAVTEADVKQLDFLNDGGIQAPQANWHNQAQAENETERAVLEHALKEMGGNISKASKFLNISRDTFYRKLKKYS